MLFDATAVKAMSACLQTQCEPCSNYVTMTLAYETLLAIYVAFNF